MFEHRWSFRPAYDHTADPNRGWSTLYAFAAAIGPKGAATLTIVTGWALPESQKRMRDQGFERSDPDLWKGKSAAIGFHSRERKFDFQDGEACEYFDGADCYFDVSYLAADEVFERFVREGESGLWAALEGWYIDYFDKEPD